MNKNIIFGVAMFLFVALFGLSAFEVMARFFEERDRFVVTKEFDPMLGWRLKPGMHYVRPSGRFAAVPLEINSFGLRGSDFSSQPQANEKRLMLLGDSFVFSRHFSYGETFAGRLEKNINKDAKALSFTRVINAGVPGYGTGQELLFLKKLAGEYGIVPNAYILMVFPNDILDNLSLSYGNYEEVAVKPRFELDASGKAILKSLPKNDLEGLQETFRHPEKDNPWKLRCVQFLRSGVADFVSSHPQILRMLIHCGVRLELPRKPGLLNGWYDPRVIEEGVPLMKSLIREMQIEAGRRNAAFHVAMIPSPIQVYPHIYEKILMGQFPQDSEVRGWVVDPLKPQRIVKEICDEYKIDFLDLYPALQKQAGRKLYLSRDGHFDRDAHEIVAAELAAWIEGNGSFMAAEVSQKDQEGRL